MVAGGLSDKNDDGHERTVEVLKAESIATGTFSVAVSFEEPVFGGPAVVADDGSRMAILGGGGYFTGYSDEINLIECSSGSCSLSKSEAVLRAARTSSEAVLIPDSLANCS